MVKSMMMEGEARGFDVSSKEGIEQRMATYNESLPPPPRSVGRAVAPLSRRAQAARRNKRKQQKAARRRNR